MLALCWLTACAAPFDPVAEIGPGVPAKAESIEVPVIEQAAFYCGPASIAMVMQWAGANVTQEDVAGLAFTEGAGGTYTADMVSSARRLGQLAVEVRRLDDLLSEVAAGHPVIVFQNLGVGIAPIWHYGVVTGYDAVANEVYLNSGQRDQMVLPFGIFERSWRRGDYWGLVVLPPGTLPETAPEAAVLNAGAALERAGQPAAAEAVYRSGAANWPEGWLWQFGLANALYAQGDLQGARAALRRAQRIAPDIPEVKANLAHITGEMAG